MRCHLVRLLDALHMRCIGVLLGAWTVDELEGQALFLLGVELYRSLTIDRGGVTSGRASCEKEKKHLTLYAAARFGQAG
jgi:hypothetical protein